jgi:hypothetical protein
MAVAADDVERTSRKAGGLCCAGDEGVAQRVEFRCLDHAGIASGQGCRQRSCGHLQRIVPGDDLRRDAIGLVHGEIEIAIAQRDRPAFDGLGLVAVIFEIARRAFDLDAASQSGLPLSSVRTARSRRHGREIVWPIARTMRPRSTGLSETARRSHGRRGLQPPPGPRRLHRRKPVRPALRRLPDHPRRAGPHRHRQKSPSMKFCQ